MDVHEIKDKIAQAARILANNGATDNRGHVSARVQGHDDIFVLGRVHVFGRSLEDVTASDVITMDPNGQALEGLYPPPGEKFLHTELYRARDDIGSVVHFHPFVAVAFSVVGKEILPLSHAGIIFEEGIPIMDLPGHIDTRERGQMVAEAMKGRKALVLRGHGAITIGASIEEACVRAIYLERAAVMQQTASQLGTPRPLPLHDPGLVSLREATRSRDFFRSEWAYFQARLSRATHRSW